MSHKSAFEALHHILKQIRGNDNLMGGCTVLLSGDFRQILPIVHNGTRGDHVKACLKSSKLWREVHQITLRYNMRTHVHGDREAARFSELLLQIGEGTIPVDDSGFITIPHGCGNVVTDLSELISRVYPDIVMNYQNIAWLSERAILAPKNEDVRTINKKLLNKIPGEIKVYTSIDTVPEIDKVILYPTEFLNSLKLSGMPSHILELKIGTPVMLLRNLNQKLTNGTRMIVVQLTKHVVQARIAYGEYKGEDVFIPRIPIHSNDLAFNFTRLQLPLAICFAMSINKSQGQSFNIAGLDLTSPCFSHGQFYVACSRVRSPTGLHILANGNKTINIVYPEVLY
eukprot:GHVR01120066.1.p1 GENE.GHVR01120066.1~~GHVR01120066.1.p1  ORF type:complete len:341 (-),score=21.51 GHVR01120066.1:188-1210(-)